MRNEIVFALSLACITSAACTKPAGDDPADTERPPTATGGRKGTGGSSGSGQGGSLGAGGSTPTGSGGSPVTPGSGGATGAGGSPAAGSGGAPASSPDAAPAETGGGSDAPPSLPPPMTGEVGAPGFPGWKYTKAIKMDTTPAGAGVAGTVMNYPVAVVLNATNFDFAQAKTQGEDLRFGKSDGTPLPYAIEHFDAAGKTASVWVRVPEVKGNDAAQSINMYWGNPAAGDASNSKAVFAAADGWLGVWHLDEDGNTTAGGYKDASAAGNNGTGVNLAPGSRAEARIGPGTKTVNMMEQWVRVDDETGKFRPMQMTASIWGRANSFPGRSGPGGYDTIYSSGEYWTLQKFSLNRVFETCFQHICAVGKTQIQTNTWYHFTVVRQGGNHRFYVNGVRDAGSGVNTRADFKPLGIGNQTQYLGNMREKRSWDGLLDEARIMNVAKDDNWIKLEFESQKEGSKFLSFGPTQNK